MVLIGITVEDTVPVILIDTDMNTDIDDVTALALILGASQDGLCQLGAVTLCSENVDGAPTAQVLLDYAANVPGQEYLAGVPIGQYSRSSLGQAQTSNYDHIRINFSIPETDTITNYGEPVDVLRQALVDATGTVKIVVVGGLTNSAVAKSGRRYFRLGR